MTAISRQLDAGLLPTPAAVLKGAQLLADGYGEVPGVGPLVVVDVGGATTDVHSIGYGEPTEEGVVRAGLAEPYAKRTVEGDLGLRHSAPSLLAAAAENIQRRSGRQPGDLQSAVKFLAANPDYVPPSADKAARQLDGSLAAAAIGLAMGRHAGYITQRATAAGLLRQQHGKDLRQTRFLIGTGGIFRISPRPWPLLDQAWGQSSPTDAAQDGTTPLIPQEPQLAVDGQYLLAPLGMLSTAAPGPALKLLRRSLKVKGSPGQADTGDKTN